MTKARSKWVCQECGYQSTGYLGKCTDCQHWGSMVEEKIVVDETASGFKGNAKQSRFTNQEADNQPVLLNEIETICSDRVATGISDLDEILGGGLVPGGVVLLAGDPGVGKSTILLQVAKNISARHDVLYVAGEESASQVRLRAARLSMLDSRVFIDARHDVCDIAEKLSAWRGGVAIIDSIQSVFHPQLSSAPGSVSQVRESAQAIIAAAKAVNVATILVGHVTKDGSIAGPRVLEHMVDVVLQFEGDRSCQLRILRAVKNRFGSTQESAIFSMSDQGLQLVDNPSALLLGERLNILGKKQAPSGTAIIATGEGNRVLLLEVQALVSGTSYAAPRRVGNGWDGNRLLQIAAVLEKKVGIALSRSDLYVNVVGGLDIDDPAGDLGVSVAIATSCLDRSVDPGTVFIGEIGLTGEVRSVVGLERRIKEARRLGFTRAIVPRSGSKDSSPSMKGFEVVEVETVGEALAIAMPNVDLRSKQEPDTNNKRAGKQQGESKVPLSAGSSGSLSESTSVLEDLSVSSSF